MGALLVASGCTGQAQVPQVKSVPTTPSKYSCQGEAGLVEYSTAQPYPQTCMAYQGRQKETEEAEECVQRDPQAAMRDIKSKGKESCFAALSDNDLGDEM